MKKIIQYTSMVFLTCALSLSTAFAQTPQKMSYQAVVRNATNNLVSNQSVGMQISILQGEATGTTVYVEIQTITSNANGLVSLEIGTGTVVSGNFATIDWAIDTYFIKTETDPTGGSNYTITGTSQLMSVPYALHAKTAESIIGTVNYTETDPVYTTSQANNITSTDITNLSNLSGTNTGDQDITDIATNTQAIQDTASQIRADFPDVNGFVSTETDPTFTAWDKNTDITIVESQISDLQHFTNTDETDPTFTISQASNITSIDITNLSNLSGTNTGDQDITGIATNTQAILDTASQIRANFPDVSGFISTETDPEFTTWGKDYTDIINTPTTITTAQATEIIANTAKNTYPTVDATKLVGIEAGAQVNVNTDWDATTGNAQILNKPDLSVYLTNETQNLNQVLTQSNDAGAQIKNVTDPTDAQDAATKAYVDQMMQIMENNGLTVVDFTADTTTIIVGSNINFTDNSTINPTTWTWDFGDGNTAVIQNPTYAYTTVGIYTVSLTVSNGIITKTGTKTNYISIDGAGEGLTDYDGNNYTSIIIDGQEWMGENLKVTHYPNGDAIPLITDNTAWGNLVDNNTDDAYSYYSNNANGEADTYGALYTYAAAIGDNWARDNTENQGVCPTGWHLPSDTEWGILITYIGSDAGSKLAGNAALWTDGNLDQNADFGISGFSILPGGTRNIYDGTFYDLYIHGLLWSATEHSSSRAKNRYLHHDVTTVNSNGFHKSYGFAVRCVKD